MYYIDPQKRKFVDIENSGQELHSDLKPRFFYGQADTVDIQFGAMVAGVWTPQAFNATDGFQFGADTNFAHTDDLLFLSEGADVTIVDAATGTISVAVDCFTVAFLAKITTQDTSAYLELKRLVSGESRPRIMMQDICYCSPAVIDTEGDPEAGDQNYYSAAQVDALLAAKLASLFVLDGVTYSLTATLDNGVPALTLVPQE